MMSDENYYDEEVSSAIVAEEDDGSGVLFANSLVPSEPASEVVVVASDEEEEDEVLATVLVDEDAPILTSNKRSRKKPGPKPKRKRTSADCREAVEEARAMLQHVVGRLPMSIGSGGNIARVRALGKVTMDDDRFSSTHHIYPVGFSCDRYE
eukprot:CAMPEP_0194154578 /NCGR_PEP_ID=MMETSP0152-20130528/61247_1 /TAXON_ID=1049557 /ORGANISM="Thalassiothrix antarctica, Strain L6-D1" /LENGTH=151 /DNA_ID=CAMNT_0038860785 /DNA_START=48 /DNA_END=500 /DNA_ORIENTATION=+